MSKWTELAQSVINGLEISREDALRILNIQDKELLEVLQGAYLIRHHYFGNKVKLNMIMNTKSGLCPENCGYCSQSSISSAPIKKYRMLDKETILKGADQAYQLNVGTYCIVASGRGPSNSEVDQVVSAVKEIKDKYNLKVCACLGILKPDQALKLKQAGVACELVTVPGMYHGADGVAQSAPSMKRFHASMVQHLRTYLDAAA